MRWLVVCASAPDANAPPGTAHAHPPGPGFPLQAPSVYTTVVTDSASHSCRRPPENGRSPTVHVEKRRLALPARHHGCEGTHTRDAHPYDARTRTPMSNADHFVSQLPDSDPGETGEWLDSLDAVVDSKGRMR